MATIISGLYGALYDQITYSVSSEFFTKMRFPQPYIEGSLNERWEVAKIGFKNTWTVGLALGFFLSLTGGLLHADNKKMFYTSIKCFFLAMFVAFFFGMLAFLFCETPVDITIENNVVDKAAFNKVTCMNNYSYVGGVIGMFLGIGWQVLNTRRKEKK
jgi:hypothetical protein